MKLALRDLNDRSCLEVGGGSGRSYGSATFVMTKKVTTRKKHQTALCYEAMGDKLLNLRIQGQHKKIQAILCVCTGVKYCVARVTL